MVLSGRSKRCKLAHALPCEYSSKRLKLAPLLGQLGVALTLRQRAFHSAVPGVSSGRAAAAAAATAAGVAAMAAAASANSKAAGA
jgi:hypothetical protein